MTADGVQVIEGAGWLEVHPDDIVLVRTGEPERQALAAVKLSDRLWVALGRCSRGSPS
jgi:Mg-chelatase subunit ChlI